MREWQITPGDPVILTLATDIRLGESDYGDDQIWSLSLEGGEPPALALQTTYGLRARNQRIFPRFTEGENIVTNPAQFDQPPVVTQIFPNYITLLFSPFKNINVTAEYWVPEPHCVTGRLHVKNSGLTIRRLRLEWVAQLNPNEGQRMGALEIEKTAVLAGRTDNLAPVIFVTGGAQTITSSYPALVVDFEIPVGETRIFQWTHAALTEHELSLKLARSNAARKWEAERARLEIVNASLLDIYTGEKEWDTALYMCQRQALTYLVGPTVHLPYPSFVTSRQPDQGFSFRGDGSDYSHPWNGQTPLEAYYLSGYLLPGAIKLVEGLIGNFLAIQAPDGSIDWKPGLAGQRSRLLATPILCTLAWRIYEVNQDLSFLRTCFSALYNFINQWFSPQHDHDQDGVPEWDHLLQAGIIQPPISSIWQNDAQGIDISCVESVALCSFLYQECATLLRMASILEQTGIQDLSKQKQQLEVWANQLLEASRGAWDEDHAFYQDRDRDTHRYPPGECLGERTGSGIIVINKKFDEPVRLLVNVQTDDETTRRPRVIFYPEGFDSFSASISEGNFRWMQGIGKLTSKEIYGSIGTIEINGIGPNDRASAYVANFQKPDITGLLPLWAGLPTQQQAKLLVENTILAQGQFWSEFGIRWKSLLQIEPDQTASQVVSPLWNSFIGRGLVQYGYRLQAANLFTKLMQAVLTNLKTEKSFRSYCLAETGRGMGERNSLEGLLPIDLFLELLGVRILSDSRVAVQGFNPFPWPVTIKYRRLTVFCQKDRTTITFPDGQITVVTDPRAQIVSIPGA